jgi:TonB family protein
VRLPAIVALSALLHAAVLLWLSAPRRPAPPVTIEAVPVAVEFAEAVEDAAGAEAAGAGEQATAPQALSPPSAPPPTLVAEARPDLPAPGPPDAMRPSEAVMPVMPPAAEPGSEPVAAAPVPPEAPPPPAPAAPPLAEAEAASEGSTEPPLAESPPETPAAPQVADAVPSPEASAPPPAADLPVAAEVRDLAQAALPLPPPAPPPMPALRLAAGLGPLPALRGTADAPRGISRGPVVRDPGCGGAFTYPEAARRLGAEGSVLLRLAIGADGVVSGAEVVRGSGFPVLDRAAREAALRCRFDAALEAGQPVPGAIPWRVTYRLTP